MARTLFGTPGTAVLGSKNEWIRGFPAKERAIPELRNGGERKRGALVVFVHANGFCKELWLPIVDCLEKMVSERTPLDVLLVDLPGHGDSDKFKIPLESIEVLGNGVLFAIEDFLSQIGGRNTYDRILGVGHSVGSTSLMIAHNQSNYFSRLFCIEPILRLPDKDGEYFERAAEHRLYSGTLKRKSRFVTRKAAVENWTGKGAFKHWKPEIVGLLARYGLVETGDSQDVSLKCDPAAEAEIYVLGIPVFDTLKTFSVPADIVQGKHSTHVTIAHAKRIYNEMRYPGRFELVDGTHFVPMENPALISRLLVDALAFSHAKL